MITTRGNTLTSPRGHTGALGICASVAPAQAQDAMACRNLWVAVILEQVQIILAPQASDRDIELVQAGRWFRSRHFEVCCALAGVDPDYIREGLSAKLRAAGRAVI